jgi:hypothetical protein
MIVAAVLVGVLVLVLGGWLVLRATTGGGSPGGRAGATTHSEAAGPTVGAVQKAGGVSYTAEAVKVDTTCAGHAYGQVGNFLEATDCTGLSRALYSGQLKAGQFVASVIRIRMPDTASARALRELADRNGSGNVSNLLREGVRYPGGPTGLPNEEYASAVSGSTVTIVETAWSDPAAAGSSAALDAAATAALVLATPPFQG